MMKRNVLLMVLGLGLMAVMGLTVSAADSSTTDLVKYQILTLKNGEKVEGAAKKTGKVYRVQLKSGKVREISVDDVAKVENEVDARASYLSKKISVDNKDAEALGKLAKWGFETFDKNLEVLKLAKADVEQALKLDPDNRRLQLLLRRIDARIEQSESDDASEDSTKNAGGAGKFPLLSKRDIYWVRLRELGVNDTKARIQFKNGVIEKYIKLMQGRSYGGWDERNHDKVFRKYSNFKQALEIRYNFSEDPSILKDIIVANDPIALQKFKTLIWPTIRQNCATAQCHGGKTPVGGLMFVTSGGSQEARDYTNFIILSGFYTAPPKMNRLLDRQNVEDGSLFLQYGLEPTVATLRHPGKKVRVPGKVRTIWPNRNDKGYQEVLKWARNLSGPTYPDYQLKWKAPYNMRVNTTDKPLSAPAGVTPKPPKNPVLPD